MTSLPSRLGLLLLCLACLSCASSQWKKERAEARAAGGVTWTNFVIANLPKMDSYLPYDQQMADVKSAYPYASPQDKKFLAGVYQRMGRDKANAAAREAREEARRQAAASPPSGYSYGGGNSGNSRGYSPPSGPGAVDKAQQRIRDRQFNDYLNRMRHNQPQLPSNPYNR